MAKYLLLGQVVAHIYAVLVILLFLKIISTALEYIENVSCSPKDHIPLIIHVLEDFLFIGPPESGICNQSLRVFKLICKSVGVSLKEEKTIMAAVTP